MCIFLKWYKQFGSSLASLMGSWHLFRVWTLVVEMRPDSKRGFLQGHCRAWTRAEQCKQAGWNLGVQFAWDSWSRRISRLLVAAFVSSPHSLVRTVRTKAGREKRGRSLRTCHSTACDDTEVSCTNIDCETSHRNWLFLWFGPWGN